MIRQIICYNFSCVEEVTVAEFLSSMQDVVSSNFSLFSEEDETKGKKGALNFVLKPYESLLKLVSLSFRATRKTGLSAHKKLSTRSM